MKMIILNNHISNSSSIYSYLLCGFNVSKKSSLVINGFFMISRLPLTCSSYFIPTRVLFKALLGMDLINCKCLAGMLKTEILLLDSGILAKLPCIRGCDETTLILRSLQTLSNIFCLITPVPFSSYFYQGSTKASGIRILIGT